jgi:tetratricopeptide (TPR) repeat protein
MQKLNRLFTLLLLLIFYISPVKKVIANSNSNDYIYCEGWQLFERKYYNHANDFFYQYILQNDDNNLSTIDAEYLEAICSAKLGHIYGEQQLIDFSKKYVNNNKSKIAKYTLGNIAMLNQDFEKAIDYYKQIDLSNIDSKIGDYIKYNLSYSYLSVKDFTSSLPLFIEITKVENIHKYDANYYAGFIEFKNEKYKESLNFLQAAAEDNNYKLIVPYLIAQIYYRQKQFDSLIAYTTNLNEQNIEVKNKQDIDLLLAEAYFFNCDYSDAIQLYEKYLNEEGALADSIALYRLAYSYYMLDDFDNALKHFKKLDLENSKVGQLACYYTGLIYISKNEFNMALAAFFTASKQLFDIEIAEKSILHYAKVNLSIENYDAVIHTCLDFKKIYPKSIYTTEINELLSLAYMSTKNYDLAIAHIEAFDNKPPAVLKIYQKITFAKAKQLFNTAEFESAIIMAQKSIKYPIDKKLVHLTNLLQGNIYSMLTQYENASKYYEQILKSDHNDPYTFSLAVYGQGYAYFNIHDYKHAYECFEQLESSKSLKANYIYDAMLRLADCAYAVKDYKKALLLYDRLTDYNLPHCYYYKGLIFGNIGDSDMAHVAFELIINKYRNTSYYEKALFEDARIYFISTQYQKAINSFTFFMKQKPHSQFISKALLYRAICYTNMNQYAQATKDYALILDKYADSQYTDSAIIGLQQSLIAEGRVKEFSSYIDAYNKKNSNSSTVENAIFNGAKALFYEQQYEPAVVQFINFLKNYPQSPFSLESQYLLAECEYAQGNLTEAIDHYNAVLKDEQNPLFTKALLRLATSYHSLKQFDKALAYYEKLKRCAKTEKEQNLALEGSIKTTFALRKYIETKKDAAIYMQNRNISVKSSNEINLLLAKIAIEQKNIEEAKSLLTLVGKSNTSVYAAEAIYMLAFLLFEEKEYKESLNLLFELNKSFPQNKVWKNKAFLLIADNYIAMQELFHATVTLNSIIEKSDDKVIMDEAQKKLTYVNTLIKKEQNAINKKSKSADEFKKI